jgi:hypothetical protein
MEISDDFKELFTLFNAHGVEYMIVGSYALAFHGVVRMTQDIDILVHAEPSNADRILAALHDFGFADLNLSPADFTAPDAIIQLGYPPVRVDLLTSIDGVPWADCSLGAEHGFYTDVPVRFLGRQELIQNKRASGRMKDLGDLDALGALNDEP